MAKTTEKSLKETCTAMNQGALKGTKFGVKVDRLSGGYVASLVRRSNGETEGLAEGLTAAEVDCLLLGVTKGLAICISCVAASCPKCNAWMNRQEEDEFTKAHWLCPTCGQKVAET